VPQPEAVNWVVWELIKLNKSGLPAYAAMHCTHGFNRTGGWACCALSPPLQSHPFRLQTAKSLRRGSLRWLDDV
jgi:hypothetical protein